ncbi:uncharacterized protein MELLADRAFT_72500 [Melampsora larici-populina 98AG31]|uniref:Vacuole protein n=1 Tax=Melampsora larici-populina (strain 98AG31 / pathotype 3-4-7) TaxID=747676 RepID=F4RUS2_MELLP|nr:uncharacterized protein MELLADRAFT_72500 [Melampsora larici-populina 98AG31]EGG03871.1 hypothetical protein MELLADRAFT_72500 [Melampsora larici-populina 98AG31]
MCCSGAQWKREEVPDHKWDFVDVREFHNSGCMSYFQYCFLYVLVIKSVLVYCSDIYTMVLLLASNHWAGSILENSSGSSAMNVPFSIGKWIFFGCIIFSFLLLVWEAKKSRAIIRSRDISYAFTNVMANNYYSMKSYDHFCFFSQINNSKKKKDDFAFFVFFTFKGWKRLLLADAPRQVINGLTLYSFARSVGFTTDIHKWYDGSFAKASVLVSMIFTVTIWVGSFILLLIAAFMYVPLLCYIQGNLKEYCCHKVDKRIAELMKRKNRKRLAKEAAIMRKEAMGDYSHLKDKKGQFKAAPLPQPTLPKIGMDELMGGGGGGGGGSIKGGERTIRSNHAYPPHGMNKYAGSVSGLSISGSQYNPPTVPWAHPGYAESTTSTDHFVSHQAPTVGRNYPNTNVGSGGGGTGGGYSDQVTESHPLSQPNVYTTNHQSGLSRAPSYSSQEERFYGDEKKLNSLGGSRTHHEYGGEERQMYYQVPPPLPSQSQQPQGQQQGGIQQDLFDLYAQTELALQQQQPQAPLSSQNQNQNQTLSQTNCQPSSRNFSNHTYGHPH